MKKKKEKKNKANLTAAAAILPHFMVRLFFATVCTSRLWKRDKSERSSGYVYDCSNFTAVQSGSNYSGQETGTALVLPALLVNGDS